jgi:hypothetical protein
VGVETLEEGVVGEFNCCKKVFPFAPVAIALLVDIVRNCSSLGCNRSQFPTVDASSGGRGKMLKVMGI